MHQLEVEYTFAAAHRLPRHPGKCVNMHGHNYKLQVVLRGEPEPDQGLVMDFADIDRVVNARVLELCDHKVLNDLLENPTAENIASWVFSRLSGQLQGLFEVRLWEVATACVVYRGPRFDPSAPSVRLADASVDLLRLDIEAAVADPALLKDPQGIHARAVREVVYRLDQGALRVAEKNPDPAQHEGELRWLVHGWLQQAVNLFFPLAPLTTYRAGELEFLDKIPPKNELASAGIRVVPPGVVRYGAHVEKGAVVMPGYVNIGARVGQGSMIDTWATVGSCAQVGRGVHLSGGVGLGGVLEPAGARPVIIEDGAFIGSRCVVVEGVLVEEEAVLGAGVVLTASTQIFDVSGPVEKVLKGRIPARSVVIPGVRPRRFPAGEYLVPCALVVGQRTASTDRKTSLNAALRDFGVSV